MAQYHKHTPVLADESVDLLVTDRSGLYIDATLGGGGHSVRILDRLDSDGILYGIDQDREAIEAARERIGSDPRFRTLHGNFGYLSTLLPPEHHGNVSGILFDLGVSTHQIREGDRGFSFQVNGPLDMRMGEFSGVSARQVVNDYTYEKLRDIIFHFGEDHLSRQIARSIVESRPLETTDDLRMAIKKVVYGRNSIKSVARVFQAVRIEVNRELDMLRNGLDDALELLKPGGRIVAISYHSLEDRIVKTFFRSGNHEGTIEKNFYGHEIKTVEPLTRQIIQPDADEVSNNPAARSARLRVAVKLDEED